MNKNKEDGEYDRRGVRRGIIAIVSIKTASEQFEIEELETVMAKSWRYGEQIEHYNMKTEEGVIFENW